MLRWCSIPVAGRAWARVMNVITDNSTELQEIRKILGEGCDPQTLKRNVAIAILELEVVLLVYENSEICFRGTRDAGRIHNNDDGCNLQIFHFVDSNSALASIIKGCSSGRVLGEILTLLSGRLWTRLAILMWLVWFSRVNTDDNCADEPSRLVSPNLQKFPDTVKYVEEFKLERDSSLVRRWENDPNAVSRTPEWVERAATAKSTRQPSKGKYERSSDSRLGL